MMNESSVRISRKNNGYEVSYDDPKIAKKNQSEDGRYRDPTVSYVFTDREEMVSWLMEMMDTILPEPSEDEYSKAFNTSVRGATK